MSVNEEFFRDLCENASDLIQSVSPEGRFLYVNRTWLHTLGYTLEEVAELNVFDVIHPDSRDHCKQQLERLMAGKSAAHVRADFLSKDGARIPVEGNVSCRFEGRRPVSTRGIFRDVRGRRRAQEELDRLFNLSLDLLCIAGTDGYFKRINPAFRKVLGYTRDELLSKAFVEFVHPDDREGTLREIENLARGIEVIDFQNRYRAKNGEYRWLAWRAAPLASQGMIYAVARDVTEHIRDQQLLKHQAAELARSNEDLEQFAYAASHDLRAPLRSIANIAEWIKEDMPDQLPEKVADHLETLQGRVRRMEQLTEDLLKYSRAGRAPDEIRRVDTAAMVRDLTALLSPPAGIVVETRGRMPKFETAGAALEQILRNLIGNAIKHHDRPQGRVTVSAGNAGKHYEFRVADDGPGIPPEHHERVFHLFQKLRPRDRVEGTGMGLALVQRLVEGHGGTIRVESEEGRGTTFRFTWPKRIGSDDGDDPGG